MKRVLTTAALGIAVAALGSSGAAAAPPQPADFTGPITGVCDFPVLIEITGKVKVIEHGDRVITVGPGQKVTLTNQATGKRVRYNIAGSFHDRVLADGTLVSKGVGRNLLFTERLGLLLTIGNVAFTVTEGPPAPEGFAITSTADRGRIVDMCQVLAAP